MPSLASIGPCLQETGHDPAPSRSSSTASTPARPRVRNRSVRHNGPSAAPQPAQTAQQARTIMRALRESGAYGTPRNVLVALLLLGDGKPDVEAAQPEIAQVAGTSVDQTRRSLRFLRRQGEISVTRHGNGRMCSRYHIHLRLEGVGV